MALKKKSKILSAALLAGSLALGREAYAQNPSQTSCNLCQSHPISTQRINAQGQNQQRRREPIYSRSGLTTVGDGILGKVLEIDIYPGTYYSFRDSLYSRGRMQFSAVDAKTGLENVARSLSASSRVSRKDRETINYFLNRARHTPHNDRGSLEALNNAIKDGIFSPEDNLNIPEGTYMINTRTRTDGVPILLNYRHTNPYGPSAEQRTQDSLRVVMGERRARAHADSLAQQAAERVRQDTLRARVARPARVDSVVARADSERVRTERAMANTRERSRQDSIRARETRRNALELGMGTRYSIQDHGLTFEAFGNVRVSPLVRIGVFAGYTAIKADYSGTTTTDTNLRAIQNIGPGTTKRRTDIVTTTFAERERADAGLEVMLMPFSFLDIPFTAGLSFMDGYKGVNQTSIIGEDRNGAPLSPDQVISNYTQSGHSPDRLNLSAGFKVRLGKNLSVGGAVTRIGSMNGWEVGARYTF